MDCSEFSARRRRPIGAATLPGSRWPRPDCLQAVLDAIPQSVFIKDDRHRWVLVNRTFAAAMGQAPEQLLGKDRFRLQRRRSCTAFLGRG